MIKLHSDNFFYTNHIKLLFTAVVLFLSAANLFSFGFFGEVKSIPYASVTAKIIPQEIKQGESGIIEVSFAIPDGYYQSFQKDYFKFEVENIPGFIFQNIKYPAADSQKDFKFKGNVVLKSNFTAAESIKPGEYLFKIKTVNQICDESGQCFTPQKNQITEKITIIKSDKAVSINLLELLQIILFAFIGGILLNFMPCVLPVLSIKVFSMIRQSNEENKSIIAGSIIYSLGIIFSLSILASIIVLIKISGQNLGWGFQFQNHYYVALLTVFLLVFALSFFDIFTINIPVSFNIKKFNLKYIDSFFTGALTVLLATPCTAPFLGTALGFAFVQNPLIIFLIFIFIAIGLSFPFLLLIFFPKALKFIPKPGAWMTVFKEFMGFLILISALWLLNVLYSETGWDFTLKVLMIFIIFSFALWIFGRVQKSGLRRIKKIIIKIISLIIISAGLFYLFYNNESGDRKEVQKNNWERFSEENLDQYNKDNKNIFVLFSAEWCLTCLANESFVINSTEIKNFFAANDIKVLYGDYTNNDPLIAKWIRIYGRAGVPVYAVYKANSKEPKILPELLTQDILKNAFK